MGTTLTGTQIQNTYDGLIKTTDNTAISATTKLISDGLGNDTCIKVGTAGTDFLGNVDFSAATVTGLPAGAAGLESGTGTDSMQSAASLTTLAANAAGSCSIALGDNAYAGTDGVSIGKDTCSNGDGAAFGFSAHARGTKALSLGHGSCAYDSYDISIGFNSCARGPAATAIGWGANVTAGNFHAVAIGCGASAQATYAYAIGSQSIASASGAYALGQGVTAATANTVSVQALETQTASTPTAGGIIMTDAGSVARRLNITAAGALQIDSTPVGGGGGAAGLVNGTGTDSLKNADSLVTNPAVAGHHCSIALGDDAQTETSASTFYGVAIGRGTRAGDSTIAIGNQANATVGFVPHAMVFGNTSNAGNMGVAISRLACAGNCAISIGNESCANAIGSVSIGWNSKAGSQVGVSIGQNAFSCWNGVALGHNTTAGSTITGDGPVALGNCATATGNGSIAIGWRTNASGACTYVIGENISSSRVCTLVTHQVESTVAGKGIVVTSPDGLTTLGIGIDNTGAIVTYTP